MNKTIHIAAINGCGISDILTASTERKLLNKLEEYLSNEAKFNTLEDFENYLYDNEEYSDLEVFFKVQEVDFDWSVQLKSLYSYL